MKGSPPESQFAIELFGPRQLRLNEAKPVLPPGPWQVVCRVEAAGLCFSDMKLLQQFSRHGRKGSVASGIDPAVLEEVPSYVPDERPTVPGHEAVVRVCAVGDLVERHRVGERYLVQTDYRWLPTTRGSNSAFGYNFEGALQEYVLMDERVITSPEGESFLIPVPEHLSASSVALVEPWACVEDAYATRERNRIAEGGRMLVVADRGRKAGGLERLIGEGGRPREILVLAEGEDAAVSLEGLGLPVKRVRSLDEVGERGFDDIVYFGADADMIQRLDGLLAVRGILNLVLGGERIGRRVSMGVGRAHYGFTRIVGTETDDPSDSMLRVPENGEIRPGDRVHVVGAGGPMGAMHVIRDLCQGVRDVTVYASDLDGARLQALAAKAERLAEENGVRFVGYNPAEGEPEDEFTYSVVMVPVPELVSAAIERSAEGGIINIFAGIPPDVSGEVDLDRYIRKGIYMMGTSGSVLEDMRIVLRKLESGALDTDMSVGAVSGMRGVIRGLEAVEKREIAGKIIVYPQLHELGLLSLEELADRFPSVFAKLNRGVWSKAAEDELLRVPAG